MHLFLRTNIPSRHLDFKRPWPTSKCGHTQKETSQSVYDCCLDYSIKCSKPAALVASDSGNEITLLRKLLYTRNLFSMYSYVFSQNLFSSCERLMWADRSEQLNHIFKGCIARQRGDHLCSGLVWSLDRAGFYQHNLLPCPSWWESTWPPIGDKLSKPTEVHRTPTNPMSLPLEYKKASTTNIWLLIIMKMISVQALGLNLLILIGCMEGSSHFLNKQWELSFSIFRVQWVLSYINKWKVQWGGAAKSFTYS